MGCRKDNQTADLHCYRYQNLYLHKVQGNENGNTSRYKIADSTAKAVVNANGGFTISWNKIDGADKYDVYIDNGAGYKLLRTVTGTSTTTGTAVYGKSMHIR